MPGCGTVLPATQIIADNLYHHLYFIQRSTDTGLLCHTLQVRDASRESEAGKWFWLRSQKYLHQNPS